MCNIKTNKQPRSNQLLTAECCSYFYVIILESYDLNRIVSKSGRLTETASENYAPVEYIEYTNVYLYIYVSL